MCVNLARPQHPDIWSDVAVKVFSEEINISISGLRVKEIILQNVCEPQSVC